MLTLLYLKIKLFLKLKLFKVTCFFYVFTKAFGITCYHLSCSIVTEWLKRKYDFLRVLVSLGSCEPAPGRAQFLSWIPALTETRGQSLWSPVTWRHSGDQPGYRAGNTRCPRVRTNKRGGCADVSEIFFKCMRLCCVFLLH